MSKEYESLRTHIADILACTTGQQVFDSLWKAVSLFNFSSSLIARVSGSTVDGTGPDTYFTFNNHPEWWEKTYRDKNYVHIDPFAQMGLKKTGPYRWSECHDNLTPAQEAMVADSQAHGLNFGINFPMHSSKGGFGVVLFGAEQDFDFSPDDMIFLEILARYSYDKICAILGEPSEIAQLTLSERERDILTLVAQGKTNWEIGAILNLSEYSVRDYLKDVSKRMQTSNRTHSVTRAIQLGLILP